MSLLKTGTLLGTLTVLLAACGTTPVPPPAPAPAPVVAPAPPPPPPPVAAAPAPAPVAKVVETLLPHQDPKNLLSTERSAYFDFDKAILKPEFNAMVERHGKYLASNPALAIRIEGNTDERGSAEYNLALGQKRAESVLRALKVFGIKDTQAEAVSWGEEKPRVTGQGEPVWSQNRRADIQYPTK